MRTAAVFDFDGTILAGYSILPFLRERVRARELGPAHFLRTAKSLAESALGRIDNRELIARGMLEWQGKRVVELDALGDRLYHSHLQELVYPEIRAKIAEHRRKGHVVVIATSAAPFQVAAAARDLGVEHVLSTQLEAKRGILTGRPKGRILWGEAKAEAVRRFASRRRIDLAHVYFYADGDEDRALMRLVGFPRPVNPRPALARESVARQWPVLHLSSRGRPGADAYLRSGLATASAVPIFLGAGAIRLLTGERRESANFLVATLTEVALALGRVQLDVIGAEHLWSHRPAVFIWNHRNIFDAQIVGHLVNRDFGAVAKQELSKVPLFAAASRFFPIAFVDRKDTRAAIESLAPATQMLRGGISMLVAPEGTRMAGAGLGEFKKGAFRMAMAADVPIVPIVIRNAEDIGSRASGTARPGTVDVAVLPPVPVRGWNARNLEGKIRRVRRSFEQTLEHWPSKHESDPAARTRR